jgi:hypothetical protein
MNRILRTALLAALTLTLVAATGCGGDTKENNEYVDAVNKAQNDFVAGVNKVQSMGASTKPEDVFTQLNTAIDKVIADLKAVDPPDDVKDLHNQLIAEMGKFDTSIATAADALKSNDPQKISEAQVALGTDVSQIGTKVSSIITEINKKLQD